MKVNILKNGQHWQTKEFEDPRIRFVREFNGMNRDMDLSAAIVETKESEFEKQKYGFRIKILAYNLLFPTIVVAAAASGFALSSWLSQDVWVEGIKWETVVHLRCSRFTSFFGDPERECNFAIQLDTKEDPAPLLWGPMRNGDKHGPWLKQELVNGRYTIGYAENGRFVSRKAWIAKPLPSADEVKGLIATGEKGISRKAPDYHREFVKEIMKSIPTSSASQEPAE